MRSVTTAIVLTLFISVNSQNDASPCPRLFVYEGKSSVPNRWYGIITLLSETDINGVWLHVQLDRPSQQLGNWFGEVEPKTADNTEYLIENRTHKLKAYTPQTVRFYIQYDSNQRPPRLLSFRLNSKTVCPETREPDVTTPQPKLQTSAILKLSINTATEKSSKTTSASNKPLSIGDDEDYFLGDFSYLNLNRPNRSSDECGTVVVQPKPSNTFTHATTEGEFPWHAALYQADTIDLVYVCGGSLISKSYIITAGHCLLKKSKKRVAADEVTVYLGKYNLRDFSSPGIQDRSVNEIKLHPRFNSSTYRNDLALLKLDAPIVITEYVRPVCLWQDAIDLSSIIHREGKIAGWGFDQTGRLSQQLMQTKMPIVSQQTCIFSYPEFYSRFTSENTFCAGFRNGTTVCNGDSGGGMILAKTTIKGSIWQLRGVVSVSVALENQNKCDPSNYIVFTDVAKYLPWIRQSVF